MSRKGKAVGRNKPAQFRQKSPRASANAGTAQASSGLPRWSAAAVCGLLLLAVVLVFGQTVRHEFIDYDDHDYVAENPHVAGGFTPSGVAWAFTQFHSNNWHPLTWLSHMLDCQLYGLEHPGGHHLTNLLLHAASVILLFLVLRQMTGDLWPSAFAAALFAIHPLHVESVAWVAERKDVLSGLFCMLTLAAYAGYARRPFSLLCYLLVTVLLALGLMAKPMLVTLPFVLLLLDYWPLNRFRPKIVAEGSPANGQPAFVQGPPPVSSARLIAEKLPWLVLAAVSCVVTYSAQAAAVMSFQRLSLPWRIANALVAYRDYVGQFFCPTRLAVFYPHPSSAVSIGKIAVSVLLLAGISAAAAWGRRKCPYLVVGWLWYLGMLVPVIGLVQVGAQANADRYAYLPHVGLYIVLAWGAARVSRDWTARRWVRGVTSTIVLASLACRGWQQASYWKNEETLWTQALACAAENYVAHNSLGTVLAERGQLDEAIAHYRTAIQIKPDYELAHYNLGLVLISRGQVEEAIAHFQKALEIKPDHVAVLNNLAWILATHPDSRFRDGPRAAMLAERARALSPSDANTLDTLAAAYAEAGRFAEAEQTAIQALNLAAQQDHSALAESLRAKIRLYETRTPFHKPPSMPGASVRP